MNFSLKIGSRASKLALVQVKEVLNLLPDPVSHEIVTFNTRGDVDKITALTSRAADDFFTDTLDEALIKKEIDVAVHSAKDLPNPLRSGLEIFALTAPIDDTDAWVSPTHWQDLPPGAKVGTSSVLRQSQVKKMRPDLQVVDIRGTIEERIRLIENGAVDGIIAATCALKRLNLTNLIRDIFPWEGTALQGQLAVVGRSRDIRLKELFKSIDVRARYGRVTLVGAGPGDPELITVKAVRALEQCDCVFYDYLVDKNLLKHAPNAEHLYAGKRKGDHTLSQEDLSRMLKHKAMQGKNVVRLKGGDPLIFGRGADEILYLNSYHIPVSVVPGISSAIGIPSSLGVPLTARGIASSVAFISGHEEDEDKSAVKSVQIPDGVDTLVFFMGLTKLKNIVAALKAKNLQMPMLVVAKGTCAEEKIVRGNVENIQSLVYEADLKPPALIIAGAVVNFYKERPRKLMLYCGTSPELYEEFGQLIDWPMIEIKPVSLDKSQQEKLVEDFTRSDLIVLTSPSSVEHFMKTILELRSFQEIGKKIFAVIGKYTGHALGEFGITAQIISAEETAQGFFKTLKSIMDLKGKRILFPRSSLPNPFLRESLEHAGALVAEWSIYLNTKPAFRPLPDVRIDGVIFTSPSTVGNFLQDYKSIPSGWEILAKGPVTESALREAGYTAKIIG